MNLPSPLPKRKFRIAIPRRLSALVLLLLTAVPAAAQPTTRDDLLRLVPGDFGLCLVVHDLRGHAERWQQSPWIKGLWHSPLGQAIAADPGFAQLQKLETELKSHLDLDWPRLRDEILGDTVVFAYQPATGAAMESGLLLVKARNAALLSQIIDVINREQKKSGELKEQETRAHKGLKYYHRIERQRSHFYALVGNLLVFGNREESLKAVLERLGTAPPTPMVEQLGKAGIDKVLAAVWLNPRLLDEELKQKARAASTAQGQVLERLLGFWQALDAVVLTVAVDQIAEVALTVQGRPSDLPGWARRFLGEAGKPSGLWQRFPAKSILSVAGRTDAAALVDTLGEFATPEVRKALLTGLQNNLGNLLGLDVADDVLPNLGPDWGFSVSAAATNQFPHALFALAVRPGTKDVDQALFKAGQILAGLAVVAHNSKSADPIRLKTVVQDKVEVKYLEGDKVFPPGLRPALALKDGYLLLASSPEAIQGFRPQQTQTFAGEVPVVRLSIVELGKFLRQHRAWVIAAIADKNKLSASEVAQGLDSALAVMDLLDRFEIHQRSATGQSTWTMRLHPRR